MTGLRLSHYTGRGFLSAPSPSSGLVPPPIVAIILSSFSASESYSIIQRLFCKTHVSEPWKHKVEGSGDKLILTILKI